jgi:hypothetical protein
MPPAFNLSQDQTLQFDLLQSLCTHPNDAPPKRGHLEPPPGLLPATARTCVSHEHQQYSLTPAARRLARNPKARTKPHHGAPTTVSTHTYRLQIVKERLRNRIASTVRGLAELRGGCFVDPASSCRIVVLRREGIIATSVPSRNTYIAFSSCPAPCSAGNTKTGARA